MIEIEKQKLIDKGTDKVTDILGGLIGSKNTPKDSTTVKTDTSKTADPLKEGVKNILGGLLKNRKKKKDSTKNQ